MGGPRLLSRLVVVAALGYFVDIYDLILFVMVRVPSLTDLGVAPDSVTSVGTSLISWQMGGMLLGGIFWGVLGDRRGRRSILFGSIALYSVANLANAFVQDVPTYAALRFVAGVGLAGELGAAVTLVSEAMPAQRRGWGTTIVSAVGILGAVAAFGVAKSLDWRAAYMAGGMMGLALLALRISIRESSLFEAGRGARGRGDLRLFLGSAKPAGFAWFQGNGSRLRRLAAMTLVGIPTWAVIGVVAAFSLEIGQSLSMTGPVDVATAVLACYIGASLGSLACGALSQWTRSRRTAILAFLAWTTAAGGVLLLLRGSPPEALVALCGALGFGAGLWAVFAQMGAEQFGTDLRATAATAIPNLVRGSVVLVVPAFTALASVLPGKHAVAAVIVLAVTVALAHLGTWLLPETYGRNLDFQESAEPEPNARGANPGPETVAYT